MHATQISENEWDQLLALTATERGGEHWWATKWSPGLVNLIPYVAYHFYTNWPKKIFATWGPLFSPSLQTKAQKKALENSDRGPSGERDKRHSQKGLLKQVALVQVG